MKRILTFICVICIAFSFAGCKGAKEFADTAKDVAEGGSSSSADTGEAVTVDPEDPEGQDVINYFRSVGLFREDGGYEIWTQDHADYWPATPVKECVGWWHSEDETKPAVMILLLSDSLSDSSAEDYNSWMDYIRENKALTADYSALRIDHLVGNMAFIYSELTLDDNDVTDIEAAYKKFLDDTGAAAEF